MRARTRHSGRQGSVDATRDDIYTNGHANRLHCIGGISKGRGILLLLIGLAQDLVYMDLGMIASRNKRHCLLCSYFPRPSFFVRARRELLGENMENVVRICWLPRCTL